MEEECKCEEGAPGWMVTFADLSTLLLTFFVLLLSFANMDVIKFRELMGSVRNAFGYQTVSFGNWNPSEVSDDPTTDPVLLEKGTGGVEGTLETLMEVQQVIENEALDESVSVESSPRGLVVRVSDSVMFKPGTDRLKPAAAPVLTQVASILGQFPCEIMVEGHTDDSPIFTTTFPSNWELSTKRAIAAMRYLSEIGGFAPEKLAAAGYADTRPLAPNDTPENQGKNRRVEFVCVRDNQQRQREADRVNELAEEERLRRRLNDARDSVAGDRGMDVIEVGGDEPPIVDEEEMDATASDAEPALDTEKKNPKPKRPKKKRRRKKNRRR
jgi:chemotaxis protein MotB